MRALVSTVLFTSATIALAGAPRSPPLDAGLRGNVYAATVGLSLVL
jgi:hypothetical protein